MYVHEKINELDDYFAKLNDRPQKGVYFCRINGYSDNIALFLKKYYDIASKSGVVIEGKIPNPDEKNLDYYDDMMGMDFSLDVAFINDSIKKWLPRLDTAQGENISGAIYDTLEDLRQNGKNENMLKNAYIKFMCWLYYRFERILARLGDDEVPKIIYDGDVSLYELLILNILSKSGCDVVLLQYNKDSKYLSLDGESKLSDAYCSGDMMDFPTGFSINSLKNCEEVKLNRETPNVVNCTNAWIKGKGIDDIKTGITVRGDDPKLFYNCFYRINGVWEKNNYVNDLYQLYNDLKANGRKIVVIDGDIPKPTNDEIAGIKRGRYSKLEEMLNDIAANIRYSGNIELNKLINNAFMEVLLAESKLEDVNLNKLTVRAVYIVCWLRRYMTALFAGWRMPEVACFIHMGPLRDEAEGLFVKFLSRLPVDVLILNPNLNTKCIVNDSLLYEINYSESLPLMNFPTEKSSIQMGTVAYHAERELDTLLYQNTGVYRDMQYKKATSIVLRTTFEEIAILWKQEMVYRPNFSTDNNLVTMPVIFAKISGVKDGNISQYWDYVRNLMGDETLVIRKSPYIDSQSPNPIKVKATSFYRNGKLLRDKIKEDDTYQYGVLREEMQEHILDKIQLLIDQRTIKGICENGTEYTIIATALNLPKGIIRVIQKFDFTKSNPKLLYINTSEKIITIEDTILTALLSLIGFDVVFLIPTGYSSVEKFFNNKLIEEHQMGNFVYDLTVPDLTANPSKTHRSLRDKLFRKGV